MRIAVAGGTGTVGSQTARELSRRGHEVRVLARRAPRFRVDLRDGSGLGAALAGVDVIVDATAVVADGTARLLRAALTAGAHHYVGVSIVGIDRVGGPYYRAKLEQEAIIARSRVPWTIVRSTQFHTLVAEKFAAAARLGIVPSAAFPLQPVDPCEVARVLADTAEAEPSQAITQFAGPEVLSLCELAFLWRRETGSRAIALPLPAPRSLRDGGLTNAGAWRGTVGFVDWLASG
jgi:uncharacterized protein YbjT (DUF2867 family)